MEQVSSQQSAPLRPPAGRTALPVTVDAVEPTGAAVRSWCEGTLGWQVVDGDDRDPVPPVVRLVDHLAQVDPRAHVDHLAQADHLAQVDPRAHGGVTTVSARPGAATVLLLPDGVEAVSAADAARRLRPAAVLRWPSQRDQLPELAERLLTAGRDRHAGVPNLLVGGSAGGVGTTTIAWALGGLRAWSGTPTLVAVRGSGLSPRAVPTAALGAADLWAAADPRPGVAGLRSVRLVDHAPLPPLVDPAIGSVVLDAGVACEVDVLVCRLDRAGAVALERTGAAVTVVVGEPLLPGRTVRKLLDGRPVVRLPWSARVARAGLRDRVPADLPGSFLAALRTAATDPVGTSPPRAGRHRPG